MTPKEKAFMFALLERAMNEILRRVKENPAILDETFVLSRSDKLRIDTELDIFVRKR